jgi:hypothetical protein
VDNKIHKVASDKVPIESADPCARVGEKVGHIPARETHRRDDADRLPVETTFPCQLVGWRGLSAAMTDLSLRNEDEDVTPSARHGYTSSG